MFARAREDWADSRAEADARLAADEPRMTGKDGEERVDSGWVQHVNTRLNYDRWLMGRRNPKVYGDTAASTTVNVGVVPQIVLNMPVELLQARPLQAEVKRIGGGE